MYGHGIADSGHEKHPPPPYYKPWAYTSSPAFFLIHGDGFTGLYTGMGLLGYTRGWAVVHG